MEKQFYNTCACAFTMPTNISPTMATTTLYDDEFIFRIHTVNARGITIDGKWRNALRSLLNYGNRHQNKGRIMVIIGLKLSQTVCLCFAQMANKPEQNDERRDTLNCIISSMGILPTTTGLFRETIQNLNERHHVYILCVPGGQHFLGRFRLRWINTPKIDECNDQTLCYVSHTVTHQSTPTENGMLSKHTLNDKSCLLCPMPCMPDMAAAHTCTYIICLSQVVLVIYGYGTVTGCRLDHRRLQCVHSVDCCCLHTREIR